MAGALVRARFSIRGIPEMQRRLARLNADLSGHAAAAALLAGGEVLRQRWSATVPVKDGHYRDSITAVASPGNRGATGLVYPADIPGLPDSQQPRRYAARLEFGSARQSKKQAKRGVFTPGRARAMQPSLRPAYDTSKAQMQKAIEHELAYILSKV